MNWKGYVFCAVMLLIAVAAWLRPIAPALADQTQFEYKMIPATSSGASDLSQLNAAGAKGWRAVGLICVATGTGNSGFGCSPQTLLVKQTM